MSEAEIKAFPPYRQAVKDFLATFKYGDLVTHEWLSEHFGMLAVDDTERITARALRDRQFAWLGQIEAFKLELLHEHQVLLQSVHGEGYRWLAPHEQTAFATREFERDARKAFSQVGRRLKNVRLAELSDDQRKENVDAIAKVSALRGATRKALR